MSPQTVLLEPPVECPPEHLPWVTAFLATCRFTFATRGNLGGAPVTASPHGYVRRDRLPESSQEHFDRFVQLIREVGFRGKFLGVVYRYLVVTDREREPWRYWQSSSYFPPVTVMLNRASNLAAPCVPPPPPPGLRLWEEPTR